MPPLIEPIKVEKWMEIYILYLNTPTPPPTPIEWKNDWIFSDHLYDELKMKVFFLSFLLWWPPLVSLQQVVSWQRSPHPPHPVMVASRETVLRLRLGTDTHHKLTLGLGAQCRNVFLILRVEVNVQFGSIPKAQFALYSQLSSIKHKSYSQDSGMAIR